jgi:type II secretory pathway component PulF
VSPIPPVLPYTRAQLDAELPLLRERLMALADTLRGIGLAIVQACRTVARIVWFYNVARNRHRHEELVDAVLTAGSLEPWGSLHGSRAARLEAGR